VDERKHFFQLDDQQKDSILETSIAAAD